ncbi:MAG TPA: GFA family protein [Verrucomicrobiae bacterium]|nr:GFA family protein [Verrucomicrobiae bacterium]
MVHCHCSRCRKGTGTGHATNLYLQPAQLHWRTGQESISRYDLPDAKSFSKWFCRHCGSPLPRISRSGKTVVLPAGSLDDPPPIKPTDQIFWGSRAPWSCASGGLPVHEEYPPGW